MSKSNISRLAKSISSKHGLTQAEAERFISKMFEVANEGLHEDKLLKIKWLGTFKVTPVKDRESVDVNTGERIVIEGRDKISFTPDNILKEIVNKPFAQFETVVVNDGVDFSDIDEKFSLQAVPAEPIAAEMPSTIGEQKTAEASIGQPESKSFDESKNTDEQKVADHVGDLFILEIFHRITVSHLVAVDDDGKPDDDEPRVLPFSSVAAQSLAAKPFSRGL